VTAAKVRDHWVVCTDYAAGPYTRKQADRLMGELAKGQTAGLAPRFLCRNAHAIVRARWWNDVHRPQPSEDLEPERATCRDCGLGASWVAGDDTRPEGGRWRGDRDVDPCPRGDDDFHHFTPDEDDDR
jgi:hypothetical protein